MTTELPRIIQGGMGVAVSSWRLAQAVSRRGQLGVVSGTGIDTVVVRQLQLGDPGGHLRAAFDAFPVREIAQGIWDRYFVPGGKPADAPFKSKPIPTARMSRSLLDLIVVSNFAEVHLAKAGHSGPVGINLLEKIQLPNLASLFGAMLAGVGVVLMGAGIPRTIPAVLDHFAAGEAAELKLDVTGALPGEEFVTRFDPGRYLAPGVTTLHRPQFLAIVSSATLAMTLARKSIGRVDGFVVEGATAGGHNAPPRGGITLDAAGEPIYGPRDAPNLEQIRALGLPFWLAGSLGDPGKLQEAIALGARGIQVGTAFAFCEESGMESGLKQSVCNAIREGSAQVFTDPRASPTGFPFKVLRHPGTASEPEVCAAREPMCDLGYLRQAYREEDGTVGFRCPGEPLEDYLRKGGDAADAVGRKCVCNGLLATIGLPQVRHSGAVEPSLVTAGNDLEGIRTLLKADGAGYSADDVLDHLLGSGNERPVAAG